MIIAALVLREHVGVWRWSAVAMGFAGVIIIAQPGGAPIPLLGASAALAWALATAIVSFLIRGMASTEEPIRIVFYFSLFGTAMVAPFLPFYMSAHDSRQWLLLGGIGVCGMLGQLCVTSALRLGAIASVVVMDYTSLIWATAYGWLVWGYLPTTATWLGAPLIVAAGIVIAWREHWLAREISGALSPPASA